MKPFRARKREKMRGVFVSRRICFLAEKNLFSPKKKIQSKNTRTKTTKLGVDENRAQHASQRHLSVLKTDSNLASMLRREYHSSCVCVCLPGRAPGGNTRHSRVRCVSSFFFFSSCFGAKFFLRPDKKKILRRENIRRNKKG